MNYAVILSGLLATQNLFAASGEHGAHDNHIPWQTIIFQCINVAILFAVLYFALRKTVPQFFASKQSAYEEARRKAEAFRLQAERENADIRVKLTRLESTADESVVTAKKEAQELKNQIVQDAQAISEKIRKEAQETVRIELSKAKNKLRTQLLEESMKLAKTDLSTRLDKAEQENQQSNFLSGMENVGK